MFAGFGDRLLAEVNFSNYILLVYSYFTQQDKFSFLIKIDRENIAYV